MTKIGTPRPPKKDGAIKFQYGKLDGELDYLVLYGNDVPRCDRALIMHQFTGQNIQIDYKNNRKHFFGDSFIDELEKRGYDTKTIRFSIERKSNE